MDFAQRRLRIGSSPWMPATLGRQGEYLWSLTNEHLSINYDVERPEFVLRTNDQGIEQDDDYILNDFMLAESGFTAFEKAAITDEEKTKPLRRHELKTMDVHLTTQLNDLSAYVTKELHQPERPRLLWEVYCGKARTAQVAESLGMEVRCFSYDTGWDFEQLKHQDEFLALLEEEAPDELLIAPECKLWSRTQSLGRRTPAQKEALKAARHRHHDRHLMFTRRSYLCQLRGGRHATIEQPKHALSWQTRALRDLPGRRADFSQCRYGAQCLDDDGIWKPVQRNTTFLTTKQAVQDAFTLHEHCPLGGSCGSRTRYVPVKEPIPENVKLADYPENFEYEEQPKLEEAPATAYVAQNAKALSYVFAMSHGGSCSKNDLMFSLLAVAQGQQCEKGEEKEEGYEHLWLWLAILALPQAGRWSSNKELALKPKTKEVEIQKDEPVVHSRLRDLLNQEKIRAEEAMRSARESRAALNLQSDEVVNLRALTTDGHRLIRNSIMEMDLHSSLITSNLMTRRACAYCASLRPPPDRVEDNSGTTLRRELEAWLADADPWRPS